MSFPNVTDLVATTLAKYSPQFADNVTGNNALVTWLIEGGQVKKILDGGDPIYEKLAFAENGNFQFFSGYETFSTDAQDVLSAAQFTLKQAVCTVVVSGRERLLNSGDAKVGDLVAERIKVAEKSMMNGFSSSFYSDGSLSGGKEFTGLDALAPNGTNTGRIATGTYGNIARDSWSFWRPYYTKTGAAPDTSTILGLMNTHLNQLTRGKDKVDLILMGNTVFGAFEAAIDPLIRFTQQEKAKYGFQSYVYKGADVVLDGGISGDCAATYCYTLNTDNIFWRPHRDANFKVGKARQAVNQDADVTPILCAGELTCSNQELQGMMEFTS